MAEQIAPAETLKQTSGNLRESAAPRGPGSVETPAGAAIADNLPGIMRRAKLDIGSLRPHEVRILHQTIGNQAVARLIASATQGKQKASGVAVPPQLAAGGQVHAAIRPPQPLQAKLTIGAPDDAHEKEADSVAAEVMSKSSTLRRQSATASSSGSDDAVPPPTNPELRRKCACGGGSEGECPDCRMKRLALQRLSSGGDAGAEAPPIVEDVLSTQGQPLSDLARKTLEPGFGHDFSHVRVHDDSKAAESASAVNAHAYTVGNHIVFGQGQYAPGTTAGQHLLAHELTHTIQQTGGIRKSVQRPSWGDVTNAASEVGQTREQDATAVGSAVSPGAEAVSPATKSGARPVGEVVAIRRQAAGQGTEGAAPAAASGAEAAPGAAQQGGQASAGGAAAGNAVAGGSGSTPSQAGASAGLIVEDDASSLSAGQMKKSDFLDRLRGPVSEAAQGALQGSAMGAAGSIAIEPWFQQYAGQSAQQLERSIQSSVPGAAGITEASAYIPLVSARVGSAVKDWVSTGAVPPGLPSGLPGIVGAIGGAVSSLAQSAGNAISNIGGMLFKAKEGGARAGDDPRAIQAQLGGGEPLEGGLQGQMSSAFGYDFSGVRVHKDNRAAQLSGDLNARAFTIGRSVAFGTGEYQPGTPIGDALIAHELAHVVQQGSGPARPPQRQGEAETGTLEKDADLSAARAVSSLWGGVTTGLATLGRKAIPALKSGLKLQRCDRKPSPTPAPPAPVPPTFDQYRDRFNALWNTVPYNTMNAALDPSLDSRGPRTERARAIFAKILTDDPTMATAYGANTGGIRDHIDVYIGPEGLNLIASPRLDALKSAFTTYPKPVPPASYAGFRGAVATAAAALTAADREAVERSNDWQMLINDYVTDDANRADIRALISPPASSASGGSRATPAQRAHFLAAWQPQLMFWDGARLAVWTSGVTVSYRVGSQNFSLKAVLPPPETNPGLALYVSAQILRGSTPLFSPPPQIQFPPDQNASAALQMPVLAPATVPPAGDPLSFQMSVLEPGAAAAMTAVSTKSLHVSVRSALAFTQAQAESAAAGDEAHLHDSSPSGLLGKMTAQGGVPAKVAAAVASGKITLHALTTRHDSAAYVASTTGAANATLEGYFVGATYGTGSLVQVVGAAGFSLGSGAIVVNRTADVPRSMRRSDDEISLLLVHEAVHHLDVRPAAGTDIERYKTEFRAYWMDGRYGPPGAPTCVGASGTCFDTTYDESMPPPGPKSRRARAIFNGLYGSATYPFVKPAYDNNTSGFREQVDSYLIPDGINLIVSVRVDSLRAVIEAWTGTGFPAFRASVQGYMGVGPAPAAGVLTVDERREVSSNRSWRDLVERKVTDPTQQGLIKSDLGIPT